MGTVCSELQHCTADGIGWSNAVKPRFTTTKRYYATVLNNKLTFADSKMDKVKGTPLCSSQQSCSVTHGLTVISGLMKARVDRWHDAYDVWSILIV